MGRRGERCLWAGVVVAAAWSRRQSPETLQLLLFSRLGLSRTVIKILIGAGLYARGQHATQPGTAHRGGAEKLSYKQQFTRSRLLSFPLFKLYHGTVYCGTFAHIYAKALYYVSESTKSCTVAG